MVKHLAAASSAVRGLIAQSEREALLLGSFPQALILGAETAGGPRVVSLLTPMASRVPNGVLLPTIAEFATFDITTEVAVGDGRIRVGDLNIEVTRWWDCRVPLVEPSPTATLALRKAAEASVRGAPAEPIDDLQRAVRGNDRRELDAAVHGLVGLGRGLTPGGDDVLSGLLIGLRATGRTATAHAVGERVLNGMWDRTTRLSADLLRLATQGLACLEVLSFLQAAEAQVGGAIKRLLSIGHTSGADLATGLAIGLETS